MSPERSKRSPWAAALLAAAAAACADPEAGGASSEAPAPPAAPLVTPLARLERGAVQRAVLATGTLYGEERATISAKVAGRIVAVHHDVGDVLQPGDPLAQVEETDYELALAERRRALEEALARLGLDALPEGDEPPGELPAVERARLQSENAQARYERGRILHQRTPPAISDQDFADIETEWEVAQAEHRLAQLDAGAQVAEARRLQAEVETAEQRLADALLVVPSGRRPPDADGARGEPSFEYAVTARYVSVGDYVQVGDPIFELIDPDPLKLRVRLPEREIARVAVGQRASLSVEAYADPFEGRVARINPAVDPATRTFEVEIAVPNQDRRLRAGSFAKVAIETELEPGVALIPRSAITTFAGVHKVFVVEDGRAAERVVTLGQVAGDRVEILRGLADQDLFVVSPPPDLTTGRAVAGAEDEGR